MRATSANQDLDAPIARLGNAVAGGDGQLALAAADGDDLVGGQPARGLAADKVVTIGRGKRELAVPTADGVAEPRNRRVEILVR